MKLIRYFGIFLIFVLLLTAGGAFAENQKSENKKNAGSNAKSSQKSAQPKKLTDAQKKELKNQVEQALKDAQSLVEQDKYKEAYKSIMKAEHGLAQLAGVKDRIASENRNEINRDMMQDPEKLFSKLRSQGEEGWKKGSTFFENATKRMKEKGIKIDASAWDSYEKAKEAHKNGDLDKAFDYLHEAFKVLRNSLPKHDPKAEENKHGEKSDKSK